MNNIIFEAIDDEDDQYFVDRKIHFDDSSDHRDVFYRFSD